MTPLGAGVIAGAVWAVAALAYQLARARAYGVRTYFAVPASDARRGVIYAFGPGMSPTAKESVREHPLAYATGMVYHLGIFASLAVVAILLAFPPGEPGPGAGASGNVSGGIGHPFGGIPRAVTSGLGILGLTGALAGGGLLARRIASRNLRRLSKMDDYISNLLTTLCAALAGLGTFAPGARPILFAAATVLLFYLPVGKIRHCIFFFTTRYHLGILFGRRGTFPPAHGA